MAVKREQLRGNINASPLGAIGNLGYGISSGANQIIDFAQKQQERDRFAQEEKKQEAQALALDKEKQEKSEAQRVLNYVNNPQAAAKINAQYGVKGSLASDPTAPTKANAALGVLDLGTPKPREGYTLNEGEKRFDADGRLVSQNDRAPKKESNYKNIVADDGGILLLDTKTGNVVPTEYKAKDYWSSRGGSGSSKIDAPENYVYAGELNIDDNLSYDLAKVGAYYTDKNGKQFINKEKYDRLMQLKQKDIQ